MSLSKQIQNTEKALTHGSFLSQEYLILMNQREIMLSLQQIMAKLEDIENPDEIEN